MGGSLGETRCVGIIFALSCLLANLADGPNYGLYTSLNYFVVRFVVMLSGAKFYDLLVARPELGGKLGTEGRIIKCYLIPKVFYFCFLRYTNIRCYPGTWKVKLPRVPLLSEVTCILSIVCCNYAL